MTAAMATTTEARAATRDASWYRRPSTHGQDLRYHVVAEEIHHTESACGLPLVSRELHGTRDVTVAASSVPVAQRCGRPGCRARWPDA